MTDSEDVQMSGCQSGRWQRRMDGEMDEGSEAEFLPGFVISRPNSCFTAGTGVVLQRAGTNITHTCMAGGRGHCGKGHAICQPLNALVRSPLHNLIPHPPQKNNPIARKLLSGDTVMDGFRTCVLLNATRAKMAWEMPALFSSSLTQW